MSNYVIGIGIADQYRYRYESTLSGKSGLPVWPEVIPAPAYCLLKTDLDWDMIEEKLINDPNYKFVFLVEYTHYNGSGYYFDIDEIMKAKNLHQTGRSVLYTDTVYGPQQSSRLNDRWNLPINTLIEVKTN